MGSFDGLALITALERQQEDQGLSWPALAIALHDQSAELNAVLQGPCMCPGALVRTARRGTMSCHYALILLRWLGRPPEDFLTGTSAAVGGTSLPEARPDERLRFDLPLLHASVDARRRNEKLTWAGLGTQLGVSPARLANLRTARLADMGLTIQLTQWLELPATRFVATSK